jgi:hypothetical protein
MTTEAKLLDLVYGKHASEPWRRPEKRFSFAVRVHIGKKSLSVQYKLNGRWKPVDQTNAITLVDVQFKAPKGKTNAWIEGFLVSNPGPVSGRKVKYNPFSQDCFTDEWDPGADTPEAKAFRKNFPDGYPVGRAGVAHITLDGITI